MTNASSPDMPTATADAALHVRRLAVQRMYGRSFGLDVEGLDPGVNVIAGPNGSGKTTLARAVTVLLWPEAHGWGRPLVEGTFRLGGEPWRVDVEGSRVQYQKDGVPASPPSMPPPGHRGRYHMSLRDLLAATEDSERALADAILQEAQGGYDVPGHTEFLADKTNSPQPTMMMVAGGLRVGLVTSHTALSEVPSAVTEEAILEKLRVIDASLRDDFAIEQPKIAVFGLNPHAGEAGAFGQEEEEVIAPALRAARQEGFRVEGPMAADGFFGTQLDADHDAALAMYHDQGLVPFKALAFDHGVNYTAGLPIVRTSPDHGTAYGIAGKGMALPGSMRNAMELAVAIARHRHQQATPAT